MQTKKTILLIGGDLCTHVATHLDPNTWISWGLRRSPPQNTRHTRWLQADLSKPETLNKLPNQITHILYAPAPAARNETAYRSVYPDGLTNLLNALPQAEHIQRCILVDSTAVWAPDPHSHAPIDENTPTNPADFRGECMLEAEKILHHRLPRRGVALRLAGLYGPGRTRLLDGLRTGRITAPDGPGHWANRIHIEDAATACTHLLTLENPADCYIGTDGHPTVTAAFYDELAALLGAPPPPRKATPPSGKRLSNARLIASGWQPRWPDAVAGYRALLRPAQKTE